jgi:hypothetical protein
MRDTPRTLPVIRRTDLSAVDRLGSLYATLESLRANMAAAKQRAERDSNALRAQGDLLLKAAALADEPVEHLQQKVNDEVDQISKRLKAFVDKSESETVSTIESIKANIIARLENAPVALELKIHTVGHGSVLHLQRLTPADSVALCFALNQKIPSRYEFLGDDSVDDMTLSPANHYAEAGLTTSRPSWLEATALYESSSVWPMKGMLATRLTEHRWMRWLARGAVLEAEFEHQGQFQNIFSSADAQLALASLLRLQKTKRVSVDWTGA